MKYVIKTVRNPYGVRIEYIGNGTYIFGGEKYVTLVGRDINEAKKYSSYKRAENAVQKLVESCVNMNCEYEIEQIEE